VLEAALKTVLKEDRRIAAAGRTDAGVHALGQVVRVSTTNRIPADRLPVALNRVLPREVLVRHAALCDPRFHPRHDAVHRTYRYRIDNRPVPDVLSRRYAWHLPTRLDVPRMQIAADSLVGTRDFAAFCSAGSWTASTVRTLMRFDCRRRGADVLITLAASAFLYRMVRNLVGTLVAIGRGALPPEALLEICESRRRDRCSAPAPARGLTLVRVDYPE
jgi:tRNA pseudouridine38-40 synthase